MKQNKNVKSEQVGREPQNQTVSRKFIKFDFGELKPITETVSYQDPDCSAWKELEFKVAPRKE